MRVNQEVRDNGVVVVAIGNVLPSKNPSPSTAAKARARTAASAPGRRAAAAAPSTASPRSPGRVRSDSSRVAILDAALKLLESSLLIHG